MTRQEVADRLEATMRYVQRVEAGEANLTLRSLAEFANALRAPVEELLAPPLPPQAATRPSRQSVRA
jgi:transcriptional regulator with XRE-family HTH domain